AGIGFFYAVALVPPLGWLRNTTIIIMVAYTMRYIPTAFGALAPSLMQIAPDLNSSARVMGADWWRATRAVTLPLLKPAMVSCFALLFIQFLKEYSTAIFLFAPGSEVIGPTLLQYWENGESGALAALAVIQVAITIIFIVALRRILKVRIYD
ncbi:MAG: iron transporter permease, partial [Hyphomicrobiales bacterium]|nr:iron transporter permease [Hyphomicrobiales bacterium]